MTQDDLPPLPKSSVTITINGVEREVGDSFLSFEGIVTAAMGLTNEPHAFSVIYEEKSGKSGRVLPNERLYPQDGTNFLVRKR